jgi:hypothetical protein
MVALGLELSLELKVWQEYDSKKYAPVCRLGCSRAVSALLLRASPKLRGRLRARLRGRGLARVL